MWTKRPANTSSFTIGAPNTHGYFYADRFQVTFPANPVYLDLLFDLSLADELWTGIVGNNNPKNYLALFPVHAGKLITDDTIHSYSLYYFGETIDPQPYTLFNRFQPAHYTRHLDKSKTYAFHWSMSNDHFNGTLDDFRGYRTALNAGAIADLYKASYYALELRLDEPPGADIFGDSSGSNRPANCVPAGGACPESGLPGRDHQALRFDGTNDYLQLKHITNLAQGEFAAGVWFKVNSLDSQMNLLQQ